MHTPTRPGTKRTYANNDEHIILIAFPRQQWFANGPQYYVMRTLPVLLVPISSVELFLQVFHNTSFRFFTSLYWRDNPIPARHPPIRTGVESYIRMLGQMSDSSLWSATPRVYYGHTARLCVLSSEHSQKGPHFRWRFLIRLRQDKTWNFETVSTE
jgi:hypothetical protein